MVIYSNLKHIMLLSILYILTYNIMSLEFEVKDINIDDYDLRNATGKIINDYNDDPCAVLRIETDIKTDIFISGSDIKKREKINSGEYYFYIPFRTSWITFVSVGYEPYQYQIPLIMNPKKTYVIKLTTLNKIDIRNKYYLKITSNPSGAKINIDGVPLSESVCTPFEYDKFNEGTYIINLFLDKYQPITKKIIFNKDDKININLIPNWSDLYIKLISDSINDVSLFNIDIDNNIRVVNNALSLTGKNKGLSPGRHVLKITDSNGFYKTIIDTLNLSPNTITNKIYNMENISGKLNLLTSDNDFEVLIDNKLIDDSIINKKIIVLVPGTYNIIIRKKGLLGRSFIEFKSSIIIKSKETYNLKFELIPINYYVNLISDKPLTKFIIYNNDTRMNIDCDSSYIKLLKGNYIITAKCKNYLNDSKKIKLNDNINLTFKLLDYKGSMIEERDTYKKNIYYGLIWNSLCLCLNYYSKNKSEHYYELYNNSTNENNISNFKHKVQRWDIVNNYSQLGIGLSIPFISFELIKYLEINKILRNIKEV